MARVRIDLLHDIRRFLVFILDGRDGTGKRQTVARQKLLCYIQDLTTFLMIQSSTIQTPVVYRWLQ